MPSRSAWSYSHVVVWLPGACSKSKDSSASRDDDTFQHLCAAEVTRSCELCLMSTRVRLQTSCYVARWGRAVPAGLKRFSMGGMTVLLGVHSVLGPHVRAEGGLETPG
ncbi:hypothetical protein AGIG_G22971 [Arapaima gigas]